MRGGTIKLMTKIDERVKQQKFTKIKNLYF